jgi:hypothetical protein
MATCACGGRSVQVRLPVLGQPGQEQMQRRDVFTVVEPESRPEQGRLRDAGGGEVPHDELGADLPRKPCCVLRSPCQSAPRSVVIVPRRSVAGRAPACTGRAGPRPSERRGPGTKRPARMNRCGSRRLPRRFAVRSPFHTGRHGRFQLYPAGPRTRRSVAPLGILSSETPRRHAEAHLCQTGSTTATKEARSSLARRRGS